MIGKSREDILYDSIVNRKLSVQEFISILQDFLQQKDSISSRSIVDKSPSVAEKPPSNQQRLLVIIPQCCYPIPGDEVVGYVTSGRGISVHRSVCPNILGSLKKEKVLPMSWSDPELSTVNIHSGEIIVTLIDEYRSVNQKIQEIVVKSKGVIRELVSIVSSRKITQLRIIVDVKDRQHLKTIQERISSINDVYDVHRSCED